MNSSSHETTALSICSFESRRGDEMRQLIERHGGNPTIAPSMREVPLEQNEHVFAFGRRLLDGEIDIMVFLTGVGTQALLDILLLRYQKDDLLPAFNRCITVVRGPKPTAVLKKWDIHIDHRAPEPNTWKELVTTLDRDCPVAQRSVAVQEYGKPSAELYAALRDRGANLLTVPVYRWELPCDLGPLQQAVHETLAGHFDVLMFTSAQQIHHVLLVAEREGKADEWKQAAARCVIVSIGPTCSEAIGDVGLHVDLEPTHPKMGWLVKETATLARAILERKRTQVTNIPPHAD
ncbi:MAG: uroporphyrinogen-III synthase [Planctomycetota bacterium]|nr:uroporphyrinogen-III synthase [Planctomycetota bacterium]MDA1212883.1 uroporphyrinogen-III synthase [Planctomycetota bacterium]